MSTNSCKYKIVDNAKKMIDNGFVVFPVLVSKDAHKKPLVREWQKLSSKDMDKMIELFEKGTANAIGMPTGKVNNVFVLDIDPGADLKGKHLPPTPSVKTGRGMHHYYAYEPFGNSVDGEQHIDIRCDGGFVVIPPSYHPQGAYEWRVALSDAELAPIPKWVKEIAHKSSQFDASEVSRGVSNGMRNKSAASVIGHVLYGLDESLWYDFGWKGLCEWNKHNTPPLPEEELKKTFISIAKRERMRREAYGK